jgi:sn-glycerol 3-phosphate transport system substrate-binding protein
LKKLTLGIMALILLLSLAPAFGEPQPTQAQDTVEITFIHIFPDERDMRRILIEEIAAAFMAEHPNVVINIQTTTEDYGDVFDGAILAASQGNAPHVVQVEDTLTQIAIDSQFFIKIGDYASEEQLASIADIIEPMRNYYNLDEEIWGLPWNASNPVMYYNPDMFAAAGLDVQSPPRTFEEVMSACDAIMSAGIDGLNGCINWPVTGWLVEQWLSMQNALFVNNDNGQSGRATETLLDSQEVLNIFTWWDEMADKGYYIYSGNPEDYYAEGLIFVTKKTAMHISTSAGISNILKFGGMMGQFTPMVTRLPLPDEDATNGLTAGGAAIWVMAGHSEAETQAAVDFVFFLTGTENDMAWHQASGYFPIRQSSIDRLTEEGWFDENPAFRIPLDQLLDSTPNVANAGSTLGPYSQVRGAVEDALQSVIDSGEDPADALSAAKSRADKAIEEYNSVIGG